MWLDGVPLDGDDRIKRYTLPLHPLAVAEEAEAVRRYGVPERIPEQERIPWLWRPEWTEQGIVPFGPPEHELQRHDAEAFEGTCDKCGAWLVLPPVVRYETLDEQLSHYWRGVLPGVRCPTCGAQPACWPDVLLSIARQNLAAWWRERDIAERPFPILGLERG